MEIIKQSDKRKTTDDKKRFECASCGCTWIAWQNEYMMLRKPTKPNVFCWCPNCNSKTWEKENGNDT